MQSGEKPPEKATENEGSLFRQVMRSREAHTLAFFIVAHLGVGVTLSGTAFHQIYALEPVHWH